MSEEPVFPLARVNARVRAVVESETLDKPLWTGGFVHHVYLADSGHVYFTLVEGDFSIRCMLTERKRGSIPFTPQDGMEVEVYGSIAVFDQKAMIQIVVEQMRLLEGQVMSHYESAEDRLSKQGLYPPKKRPLPTNIGTIRLVTSRSSQAIKDFENTYRDHNGTAQVRISEVLLEGDFAAQKIADKIRQINEDGSADVMVLTRGGGRRQMLSVFNDYLIAEAICRSRIPIVTGIGHANDETLADRVADVRTDTPTAAAVLLAGVEAEHRSNEQIEQREKQQAQQGQNRWQQIALIATIAIIGVLIVALVVVLMQS